MAKPRPVPKINLIKREKKEDKNIDKNVERDAGIVWIVILLCISCWLFTYISYYSNAIKEIKEIIANNSRQSIENVSRVWT